MDEKRDDTRDDKDLKRQGFKDSASGKADQLKGRVKDAAGGLTGDRDLQAEGKIDQAKGKIKDAFGKIERKLGESSEDDDL
jgi:uncharacterized protein YjbJ (UPF0337 family)